MVITIPNNSNFLVKKSPFSSKPLERANFVRPLQYKKDSQNEKLVDYYEILQVPFHADSQLIKKQFRELQKEHHPDSSGEHEMSILLNKAYVVLSDDEQRKVYDQKYIRGKGDGKKRVGRVNELKREEGLVKQAAPDVPLLNFQISFSEHTIEEIQVWIREWCNTLAFGCNLPLPIPVQADPIKEGARLSFLVIESNTLSSVGELLFKIKTTDDVDNPTPRAVEVWRRVWVERVKDEIPGEKEIVSNFKTAFEKFVEPKKSWQHSFSLAGVSAAVFQGLMPFLPVFGEDAGSGYEAYHLSPSLKMIDEDRGLSK